MKPTTPQSATRRRLLATAMTGVVAMQIAAPVFAQSSVDLDLLNGNYTRLSTSTALVDNYQNDDATNVTANAQPSSGGGSIDVTLDLVGSGGNDAIDGSWSLTDNQINASAYSNTADNAISASTAPAFADSSAVSNLQVNSTTVGAYASSATVEIDVYGSGADTRFVSGASLLVDGNGIAASANGNTSTNTIEIADGVSVAGTPGLAATALSLLDLNAASSGATNQDVAVDADLAIVNAQINEGDVGTTVTVNADALSNDIMINAEQVRASTLTLSGNSIASTAKANTASSSLSTGGSAASVNASMAVANLQASDSVDVFADTELNRVFIDTGNGATGYTDYSSVTLDQTTITATAFGNDSVQTLSIDANDISSSTTVAASISGTTDGILDVDARASVTNMQLSDDSDVNADVIGNDVYITTGNGTFANTDNKNTITVSDTTFDAVAVSNRSTSQAVSLTGNIVGTGVAVASSQAVDGGIETTADALENEAYIVSNADSGAVRSTVVVADSLTRALAIGNLATTRIAVDGNDVSPTSVAVASGSADVIDAERNPRIGEYADIAASFVSLNDQFNSGSVSADVFSGGVGIGLYGGDTSGSTVSVIGNDALAAAIGSDATNTLTLGLNNVDAGGFAALAAALTQQSSSGGTIEARALPDTGIYTNNDIFDSTVSVDGNSVEATATANRSGLLTSVTANNIDTGGLFASGYIELDGDQSGSSASILGETIQSASGSTVTAILTEDLDPSRSAEIHLSAGEDVGDSVLSTDLNVLRASATGNVSTTTVSVDGGSSLETTVGGSNVQETDETTIMAVIGVEDTDSVTYDPFTVSGTNDFGSPATFTSAAGAASTLNANQIAWLQSIYGADLSIDPTTQTITLTNAGATTQISGPGGTIGGNAQIGGHFVRIDDTIVDSTVSVAGNLTEGSVLGNTATTTVTVDASQILDGAGYDTAVVDDDFEVLASNMAQNTQKFFDTSGSSEVYGVFAIDTVTDETISGSTLTVDGNTQLASVTANEGTTALSVSGTGVESTTGLQNGQDVDDVDIAAQSDAWVYSPMQMADSTLDITSNVSQASAEGNVATNTVSVTATDLAPAASAAAAALGGHASGTVSLGSEQVLEFATMEADASLSVYNEHEADTSSLGVYSSSINVASNTSAAEVTANKGINALSIDATNSTDASAVLNNEQIVGDRTLTTTADARIEVRLTENEAGVFAINDSVVDVSENRVMALSTANTVTNTVDISATNVDGVTPLAQAEDGPAGATFLLSNDQSMFGIASSTVTDTDVQVELNNGTASGNGVTGSTLAVDGNTFTAQTIGNRGTNALNAGVTNTANASYAINAGQETSGSIAANVSSTNVGVSIDGVSTAADSTISVRGNRSLANAIGNMQSNSLVLNASSFDATGVATAASPERVEATALVRNDQSNDATITSTSDNVSFAVALNAGSGSAMSADSVSLSGNSITSRSVANSATSSLLISGLAEDTGNYAVQSVQSNGSNVIASVRNADITGVTTGTLANAMASISGNSIGATATANTAVNRISR